MSRLVVRGAVMAVAPSTAIYGCRWRMRARRRRAGGGSYRSLLSSWGARGGDGAARDVGERGHAELDRVCLPPQRRIDLGELVLGSGEADLEALDFAEPAFALGFGDAVVQVGADLLQPAALGGIRPQE